MAQKLVTRRQRRRLGLRKPLDGLRSLLGMELSADGHPKRILSSSQAQKGKGHGLSGLRPLRHLRRGAAAAHTEPALHPMPGPLWPLLTADLLLSEGQRGRWGLPRRPQVVPDTFTYLKR